MNITPVIAIFDVGKTNKKLLLFDEGYKLVREESIQLPETTDEDGFPCEDIQQLTSWILRCFIAITNHADYIIKAVNFSAYGASFVFLNGEGKVFLPLYNYLKPFPSNLRNAFYDQYGGVRALTLETASPALGNLNSGLQLYRLKKQQASDFETLRFALHLPQYLSFILSNKLSADITSVGCHTHLWDFQSRHYHSWVSAENILDKLPSMLPANSIVGLWDNIIPVGIGLHDSSAALIPYLAVFTQPFVLLSTGTWCICLNPFNDSALTEEELTKDCLCFLTYEGKQVKASRLFTGNEHEQHIKKLATHFNMPPDHYTGVQFSEDYEIDRFGKPGSSSNRLLQSGFEQRDLCNFISYEHAYHQLMSDIVELQVTSLRLVLGHAKRIFVDGGFGKNEVFMHLLARAVPELEVMAATVPQASAMGAAMAIHSRWNNTPLAHDIIELKFYPAGRDHNV